MSKVEVYERSDHLFFLTGAFLEALIYNVGSIDLKRTPVSLRTRYDRTEDMIYTIEFENVTANMARHDKFRETIETIFKGVELTVVNKKIIETGPIRALAIKLKEDLYNLLFYLDGNTARVYTDNNLDLNDFMEIVAMYSSFVVYEDFERESMINNDACFLMVRELMLFIMIMTDRVMLVRDGELKMKVILPNSESFIGVEELFEMIEASDDKNAHRDYMEVCKTIFAINRQLRKNSTDCLPYIQNYVVDIDAFMIALLKNVK